MSIIIRVNTARIKPNTSGLDIQTDMLPVDTPQVLRAAAVFIQVAETSEGT